ncbi:RfbX Membrane protein involved in the export of O-antigen and teichoic acid [Candidatus Methylopumilus planktonicus]
MIAAIFSIPALITELGEARFGLLAIIWSVVSYFGLLDLGLGRALTQFISSSRLRKRSVELKNFIGMAMYSLLFLGFFGGILMGLICFYSINLIKTIPNMPEARLASALIAISIPAIMISSGYRGILEAYHKFAIINLIRVPSGIWTFAGPLLVLKWWGNSLVFISIFLVLGRYLTNFFFAYFVKKTIHSYGFNRKIDLKNLKPLLTTGGWMTLSNLVSQFMGIIDRLLIGAIISASAVAFYVTPQEIVTKLLLVPGAVTLVLFPIFSAKFLSSKEIEILFVKSTKIIITIVFPAAFFIGIFSDEILNSWLNQNFAEHSALIMRIFTIGIVINSVAQVAFVLLQSAGLSKVTAIINIIQLPVFICILIFCAKRYGIEGAAYAWLLRLIIDAIMMFFALNRSFKNINNSYIFKVLILILTIMTVSYQFIGGSVLMLKLMFFGVFILTSSIVFFRYKTYFI